MSEEIKQPEQLCRICKASKVRVQSGIYNEATKAKRFVDAKGKQWSGRVCPDCHRDRVKVQVKDARNKGLPSA